MFSMSTKKTKIWMSLLITIGLLLVIGGAVLLVIFPKILDKKIKENLILKAGTATYDKWVESPVPIYLRIYFLNVTNPDGILSGEKPAVNEIGPFMFEERRKKIVTGWNDETGSVHYINQKYYYYVAEESMPLDTLLTTVNIPLLTISKMVEEKVSFFVKAIVYSIINNYKNDTIFIKRTASELLFEGFKIDIVADTLKAMQSLITTPPPFKERFGFLLGKNGSLDEFYSVYTGAKGIENYTQIETYLNSSSLPFWHTPYCNMLNGTDGKQFPFPLSKDKNIYVFSPELCRSLYLEYDKDVDIEGINAYSFVGTYKLFDRTPENTGFCTNTKNCPKAGIHQVSLCKKGAPIVISAPHFYEADPFYYNAIDGMKPEKELHQTKLDVEPQTGVTLQAKRRIMISVETKKNKLVNNLKNVPDFVFPVMWTEQSARIPEDLAAKFVAKVKRPAFIATIVLIIAIALGAIWVIIGTFLGIVLYFGDKDAGGSPKKDNSALPVAYKSVPTQLPSSEVDKVNIPLKQDD